MGLPVSQEGKGHAPRLVQKYLSNLGSKVVTRSEFRRGIEQLQSDALPGNSCACQPVCV